MKCKQNHRALALVLLVWGGWLPAFAEVSVPEMAATAAEVVAADRNLYRVDAGLYRSEQLGREDIARLQSLGVRTVVNLRFFDRDDNQEQLGDGGFTLVSTPLLAWWLSPEDLARALWAIEQHQPNGPVLVHCYHGADRTGLVVAMYRIIYQNWAPEQARREMQQGPYGFHRVWRHMDRYFEPAKIEAVRRELALLRQQAPVLADDKLRQ